MLDFEKLEKVRAELDSICRSTRTFKEQSALYCFSVPGDKGEEVWLKLKQKVSTTGCWPIIIGAEDDCEEIVEAAIEAHGSGEQSVSATLQRASTIDPKEWLASRYTEHPDYYETDEEEPAMDFSPDEIIAKKYMFSTLMDLEQQFHSDLNIALVPTTKPWEVPAYLYFGGWNECPLPEQHVALFKYWYQKYEAEVFAISRDVVEMYVRKPPKTHAEAIELAREQFVYCSDIVHQGANTVQGLADEIVGSNGWFFWWD